MKTLEQSRKYNREWMRKYREDKRIKKKLLKHQCPVCGLIMKLTNERLHKGCPYYDNVLAQKTIPHNFD